MTGFRNNDLDRLVLSLERFGVSQNRFNLAVEVLT
jgi:hypothetical protein